MYLVDVSRVHTNGRGLANFNRLWLRGARLAYRLGWKSFGQNFYAKADA
jgi:hypothetical protein